MLGSLQLTMLPSLPVSFFVDLHQNVANSSESSSRTGQAAYHIFGHKGDVAVTEFTYPLEVRYVSFMLPSTNAHFFSL
jgi:hypothetical protein